MESFSVSDWHQLSVDAALSRLECNAGTGLSPAEVARRREQFGTNELSESGLRGPWTILREQFQSSMVLMLVVAAMVSAYLGEYTDAVAIVIIVFLNAGLGFAQDYRAERALAALKRLAVPRVHVRRDGRIEDVLSCELVPGDVVVLEAGNLIPADCRLIAAQSLLSQEASLTGESEPIEKQTAALDDADLTLGDRTNMVYMGTLVTLGRGEAVVVETGMRTQLGQIAGLLQKVKPQPSPLERRLTQLSRSLAVAALLIVSLVFVLGLTRGEEIRVMLLTSISLAVAAVPEGLPAVATVALALGARRMFQRRALIRRLSAVETLGSVTVICSDKTGTLTQNRMTVALLEVAGHKIDLAGLERGPTAGAPHRQLDASFDNRAAVVMLLAGGALCNDAKIEPAGTVSADQQPLGDPTEAALVVAAGEWGLHKSELERFFPRVDEVPFDSDRKRMTTVHAVARDVLSAVKIGSGTNECTALVQLIEQADFLTLHPGFVVTKGATDSVLDRCTRVWSAGAVGAIDDDSRRRIKQAQDEMAAQGMRVLGLAVRALDEAPVVLGGRDADAVEHDLIFVGLIAMIDPPRPEAREAVARCRTAGIRPVMITGDHPLTARHIARELGIDADGPMLTGRDLEELADADLENVAEEATIYARVSPSHKLRIVEALGKNGHITAMTGDGVNDAPALKRADIGVAMGIAGTDVAKEAAEMLLLDDNFATIVNAVEEGRIVYDNIRKFMKYVLASNVGEILVMLLAPICGMPLPLLPLQILWVNLVTDGLPALALGVEPAEKDIMRRPPHPPGEHIFSRGLATDILWLGTLVGLISFLMGYWFWRSEQADSTHWRTILFTVLTISQMGIAMTIRAERQSLFQIGVMTNKQLAAAVLLTLALQIMVVYVPFFQRIFHTQALSLADLSICIAASTLVFWSYEAKKWLMRFWVSRAAAASQVRR